MAETPMTPVRVVEGQQARPRMPFEQSKEEIVQQSLMRKKEDLGLDPRRPEDALDIEALTEEAIVIADAPREITGEAKVAPGAFEGAADLIGGALGAIDVFNLGLSKVGDALKTKELISKEEKAKLEDQFQNEFIPKAYDDFLKAHPDADVGYDAFKEKMIEAGGTTGRALYDVNEGYFQSFGPILEEYILGFSPEEASPFAGTVRERTYANALRDLLLIEAGVTAAGEEILADTWISNFVKPLFAAAGGEFDDVEGLEYDKSFGERWADNLREARGIEELAEEYAETVAKTSIPAIASYAAADKEDVDAVAEGFGDLAWFVGLGASFVLPLDLYLGNAAKAAYKGAGKAAKGFTKAGSEAASQAGKTNLRATLAEELALSPADARVQLVESVVEDPVATRAGRAVVDDAVGSLTEADLAKAKSAGVDLTDANVRQDVLSAAAEKLQALFPVKETAVIEKELEAAGLVGDLKLARLEELQDLQKSIAEVGRAYRNSAVKDGRIVALDRTGTDLSTDFQRILGEEGVEFMVKDQTRLSARALMGEMVAMEIAQRGAAKAIAEGRKVFDGKNLFGLPENLTMLTPRVIVPKSVAAKTLTTFRGSELGKRLVAVSESIAKTGVADSEVLGKILKGLGDRLSPSGFKAVQDLAAVERLADPAVSLVEKAKILNEIKAFAVEATARSVSPFRLLSMDDIERLYAGARKTITKPLKGTPIIERPSRIADKVRAAATVEELKELTKPAQLRRSAFAKGLSATTNALFPDPIKAGKYFSWKGLSGGVYYDDAINTLRNSLGNIGDVLDFQLRQLNKGRSKLGAYAELHKRTFMDRATRLEGTPSDHFVKFIYSGYGVVDSDADLLLKAGQRTSAGGDQARFAEAVAKAMANPETPAEKAIAAFAKEVERTFPEFDEGYFEFLVGINKVLKGLDLPNAKWVVGDDVAKHLSNLLVSQKRVQIVEDFTDEITRKAPAAFALRGKDILGKSQPLDTSSMLDRSNIVDSVLTVKGIEKEGALVDSINEAVKRITAGVAKDNPRLVRAAVEDLIAYKNGSTPRKLETLIKNWLQTTKLQSGETMLDVIRSLVVSVGDDPIVLMDATIEATRRYLQNTPGAGRIFEQSYLTDIGKHYASKEDVVRSLEILKRDLDEAIKKGAPVAEEGAPVSFYQAIEDLPLYVFDSKASIRADVAGLLKDKSLNVKWDYVHKAWLNSSTNEEFANKIVKGLRNIDGGVEGLMKLIDDLLVEVPKIPEAPPTQKIFNRIGGLGARAAGAVLYDLPRHAKQGLLGGFIVPNPMYHTMNNLSAPALIHDTIGLVEAINAAGDVALALPRVLASSVGVRTDAVDVVKALYGYNRRGNEVIVAGRADGVSYTIDDVVELITKNGINQTQVSIEVQRQAVETLVSWTGKNFQNTSVGFRQNVREFFTKLFEPDLDAVIPAGVGTAAARAVRDIPGGLKETFLSTTKPNIYNEFSSANDLYYRTGVLLRALKRGQTEAEAVDLARTSLYDYGKLTQLERDTTAKGFWIYSFWRQSIRQTVVSVINNPRRLANNYKLGKGGYDPDAQNNELQEPFMSQYQDKSIFVGSLNDPETQQKWNYYFGDLPMLGGLDTVVNSVASFGAFSRAVLSMDLTKTSEVIGQLGRDYIEKAPPYAKLLAEAVFQEELSFGDFRREGTYINPAYLQWAEATGGWDAAVVFFDLQPVYPPREGKPTFHGSEWRINPDNKQARKFFYQARNVFLLSGLDRNAREIGSILTPSFIEEAGRFEPGEKEQSILPAETFGLPAALSAFAEGLGIYKVEEAPTELTIQPRIERAIKEELD
jgi:hypothetical protein